MAIQSLHFKQTSTYEKGLEISQTELETAKIFKTLKSNLANHPVKNREREAERFLRFFTVIATKTPAVSEVGQILDKTANLPVFEKALTIHDWFRDNLGLFSNIECFEYSDVTQFLGVATESLLLPNLDGISLRLSIKSIAHRKDFDGLKPFLKGPYFDKWPHEVKQEALYSVSLRGGRELAKDLIHRSIPNAVAIGVSSSPRDGYKDSFSTAWTPPVMAEVVEVLDKGTVLGEKMLFTPKDWGEALYQASDAGHIDLVRDLTESDIFKGVPRSDVKRSIKIAELKAPDIAELLKSQQGSCQIS